MTGALSDIRILDLSRVLAGPVCTQIFGDLGADIIKIERPGTDGAQGDDTRRWGPPFLKDSAGQDTAESAYYLSANRNKRSITVDITTKDGQALIKSLLAKCDILIENFKVGGLEKYGLSYDKLKAEFPALIYCSITGFGQNGPLATEPGYDFLAQAMSGLMACTGEPDGAPMKAGVALSDIMTGHQAAIAILAALHHREKTGQGQYIDVSLLDSTIAAMTNIAQYYLTSGTPAPRLGNAHSTIVPYQAFAARDGYVILAVGNDRQFRRFCDYIDKSAWADDPRFATNSARIRYREPLIAELSGIMAQKTVDEWLEILREINVPGGPVNNMDHVFAEPQVKERDMAIEMKHPLSDEPVKLVGSPLKMSGTPVSYRHPPPTCGQHTDNILQEILGLSQDKINELKEKGIL